MMIREFYPLFSSTDEPSLLFEILRKVSRLESLANLSMEDMAWVGWPPDGSPGDGGDAPARA